MGHNIWVDVVMGRSQPSNPDHSQAEAQLLSSNFLGPFQKSVCNMKVKIK